MYFMALIWPAMMPNYKKKCMIVNIIVSHSLLQNIQENVKDFCDMSDNKCLVFWYILMWVMGKTYDMIVGWFPCQPVFIYLFSKHVWNNNTQLTVISGTHRIWKTLGWFLCKSPFGLGPCTCKFFCMSHEAVRYWSRQTT